MLRPGIDAPVWTKDPPTEPGIYWYSLRTTDEAGEGVLRFCRVTFHQGNLIVDSKNYDADEFNKVEHLQRWWAGYLPEPIPWDDGHGDSWPPTY